MAGSREGITNTLPILRNAGAIKTHKLASVLAKPFPPSSLAMSPVIKTAPACANAGNTLSAVRDSPNSVWAKRMRNGTIGAISK